jgi:hypothetical protein
LKKEFTMRSFISIAASVVLSTGLYAQTIQVNNNWQLLGAIDDISDMAHFKTSCVDIVWTFTDGKWNSFKPSLTANTISQIVSGTGFWIKGTDESCDPIDFTATIEDIVDTVTDSEQVTKVAQAVALAGDVNGQTGDSLGDVSNAMGTTVQTVNSINRALSTGDFAYNDAGYSTITMPLPDGSTADAIIKFYDASTDEQITVDITDSSNWMPGGALSSYLVIDMQAMTGYPDLSKLYMIIEVNTPDDMQMPAGSVSLGKLTSEKTALPSSPDDMPSKIVFNANGVITMNNGDSWEQKNMILNTYPATPDVIDGSYQIEETINGKTYTGTATFDQGGCTGADISEDGTEVGTLQAVEGELFLTVDGLTEPISLSDI